MRQDTFEKAKMLEKAIYHVEGVIKFFPKEYKCEPPTRDSALRIRFGENAVDLNEGEAVTILKVLEDMKSRLHKEFEML